jgi:Flp pilus assembly protein TadB
MTTETQRIGYTMQQLVWKPANNVKTKSMAGMVAKFFIVCSIALVVFLGTAVVIFYTSKLSWQVKVIVSVAVIVWIVGLQLVRNFT